MRGPWDAFRLWLSVSLCPLLESLILARRERVLRGYLREGPYAGMPHVWICEGESQMAELLDHAPAVPSGSKIILPS